MGKPLFLESNFWRASAKQVNQKRGPFNCRKLQFYIDTKLI